MKAYRKISGVLLTDILMIYKYENKFQLYMSKIQVT